MPSATETTALDQKLSEDRPGMLRVFCFSKVGESEQVGNEKTKEGQAENRRAVVRVLQNKAIAGVQG